MLIEGHVGDVKNLPDGSSSNQSVRLGRQGDVVVSELHGRFYEQTYRGNVFAAGLPLTGINAATFTVATTGATATPIIGIYNPITSGVNLSILQAKLGLILTSLTATGCGPYAWMGSAGNIAVTTGVAPVNTKTLATTSGGVNGTGSVVRNVSGVALTGLTNVLVFLEGSSLYGGSPYNISVVATAAGMHPSQTASIENLDGSLIVPPGGVLALMSTTTAAAHSAVGSLVWEEVPI